MPASSSRSPQGRPGTAGPRASAPQAVVADAGAKPDLAWLPVQRCRVNDAYQRSIKSDRSQMLIARIAADFRWAAFQAVLAAPDPEQDGWFLILDGQHRVEAARRRGIDQVPAVVVEAPSIAEQALAFVRANKDRVALTALAMFHAAVVAGDEEAKAIAAICRTAKVTIPAYQLPQSKMQPGETLALGAIRILLRKQGRDLAQLALDAVADAWRTIPGALKGYTIRAAATLLQRVTSEAARYELAGRITTALTALTPERLQIAVANERAKSGAPELLAYEVVLRQAVTVTPVPKGQASRPVQAKAAPKSIASPQRPQPAKPTRAEAIARTATAAAQVVKPAAPATMAKAPAVPNSPTRPPYGAASASPPEPPTPAPPPAPSTKTKSKAELEQEEIDRHLATKGATRAEPRRDVDLVMNTIRRRGYVVVALDATFRKFEVDGKPLDRDLLVAMANHIRGDAAPWTVKDIAWDRPPPPESPAQKAVRERAARRGAAIRQAGAAG